MQVERVRSALPVTKKVNSGNYANRILSAARRRKEKCFFVEHSVPKMFKHCVKKKEKKKNLLFRRHDVGCSPPCSQIVILSVP